ASRHQAAMLCPAYADNVLREACEFPARSLPLDLFALRALEKRYAVARRGAAEDALTWTALGLLHCHLGRVESARECYRQATRHFPAHPELGSTLARPARRWLARFCKSARCAQVHHARQVGRCREL